MAAKKKSPLPLKRATPSIKKKGQTLGSTGVTVTSKSHTLPSPVAYLTLPAIQPTHAVVENLQPTLAGGRHPIKAIPGEVIFITADIFRDGHEKCEAFLLWRKSETHKWARLPMAFVDNDQWGVSFTAPDLGEYEFTVEAHTLGHGVAGEVPYRDTAFVYHPFGRLRVDPKITEYSAWYEMWARSQGTDPQKSASFSDMEARLSYVKDLGFDVLYLPPIHPIGRTKRKGANNALVAKPGEPGCPYAIGNERGGHKAVDPELGTLEQCRHFLKRAREEGFTLALDFALNCSPDHPYVKKHPDWFYHEADGSIKCAENPPKRYEDVYPLNFFCEDKKALWLELKSVLDFWIEMGFTIFRVDNPHTKPFVFWEWLIGAIKKEHPEVVFLSEAFTRPKVMQYLAKIGFDMSYTYFTWRTTADELRAYAEELTQGPSKHFMKGIFFPTTPDILPVHLQNAPREMFMIRFVLAATLSSTYGMYNSYEICESTPYPGKEEFYYSEKYQYKVWDWNRPGNIKEFIKAINHIRHDSSALHSYKNLTFHTSDNPALLAYSKAEGHEVILVVVNLDPQRKQGATLTLNLSALNIEGDKIFGVQDLLSGENYVWTGARNYVELTPQKSVCHILKLERF